MLRRTLIAAAVVMIALLIAGCEGIPADCFCNQTVVITNSPVAPFVPLSFDLDENAARLPRGASTRAFQRSVHALRASRE